VKCRTYFMLESRVFCLFHMFLAGSPLVESSGHKNALKQQDLFCFSPSCGGLSLRIVLQPGQMSCVEMLLKELVVSFEGGATSRHLRIKKVTMKNEAHSLLVSPICCCGCLQKGGAKTATTSSSKQTKSSTNHHWSHQISLCPIPHSTNCVSHKHFVV
jgi:hypothetical protein